MKEKGVVCMCKVKESVSGKEVSYVGLTERTFKDRLTKHRSSINNQGYHKNSLSNHIWDLKRKQINFELSWRLLAKAKPYSPSTKVCNLCIKEIVYIMYRKDLESLIKKNEFFGFCLHRAKYLLENQ